jgi:hypothetical protein
MAFNLVASSNEPPPPLQEALSAEPLKLPASVTAGLLAQTVWSGPAAAVAVGETVSVLVSEAFVHDVPAVTVSVAVTVPTPVKVIVGFSA